MAWLAVHSHHMAPVCKHSECTKQGYYGVPGVDKGDQWCKAHAPPGCVNIVDKHCDHGDCKRQPTYGFRGVDKRSRWCKAHRPAGATDLRNRRCEQCDIINPAFGVPGVDKHGRWCKAHGPPGCVDMRTKRCHFKDCDIMPAYGVPGVDKRGKWCKAHAPADAVDLVNKRCQFKDCTVISQHKAYCANHDTENKRLTRVRENQVANFLRDQGLHWTAWNKQLTETACGRYRPDFAFELPTHVVVVEVDEHQHAQPGYACDNARMLDIFGAYGGLPVVFIRFNPDAYEVEGVRRKVQLRTRLKVLGEELRAALATKPKELLTIARLFYDGHDVMRTWVAPDDPAFSEKAM